MTFRSFLLQKNVSLALYISVYQTCSLSFQMFSRFILPPFALSPSLSTSSYSSPSLNQFLFIALPLPILPCSSLWHAHNDQHTISAAFPNPTATQSATVVAAAAAIVAVPYVAVTAITAVPDAAAAFTVNNTTTAAAATAANANTTAAVFVVTQHAATEGRKATGCHDQGR